MANKVIKAILEERDRRYAESFQNLDRRIEDMGTQLRREVASALASAKEAISKQEDAYNARFQSINEFRQTLSDQTATFIPRSEAENRIEEVKDKIDALSASYDISRGKSQGLQAGWGYFVAICGMFAGAIATAATIIMVMRK
jgi:chromosome segregation ATPase